MLLHFTPPVCNACPQITLLRDLFKKALGPEGAKMVDINTIDGFQVGGHPGVFRFF